MKSLEALSGTPHICRKKRLKCAYVFMYVCKKPLWDFWGLWRLRNATFALRMPLSTGASYTHIGTFWSFYWRTLKVSLKYWGNNINDFFGYIFHTPMNKAYEHATLRNKTCKNSSFLLSTPVQLIREQNWQKPGLELRSLACLTCIYIFLMIYDWRHIILILGKL